MHLCLCQGEKSQKGIQSFTAGSQITIHYMPKQFLHRTHWKHPDVKAEKVIHTS